MSGVTFLDEEADDVGIDELIPVLRNNQYITQALDYINQNETYDTFLRNDFRFEDL